MLRNSAPEAQDQRQPNLTVKDKTRRSKVVLASKITGGRNVNAANIIADVDRDVDGESLATERGPGLMGPWWWHFLGRFSWITYLLMCEVTINKMVSIIIVYIFAIRYNVGMLP